MQAANVTIFVLLLLWLKVKCSNPNTTTNPNTNPIPNTKPNPTDPELQVRIPAGSHFTIST